jgi:hypothetical protein
VVLPPQETCRNRTTSRRPPGLSALAPTIATQGSCYETTRSTGDFTTAECRSVASFGSWGSTVVRGIRIAGLTEAVKGGERALAGGDQHRTSRRPASGESSRDLESGARDSAGEVVRQGRIQAPRQTSRRARVRAMFDEITPHFLASDCDQPCTSCRSFHVASRR